MDGSAPQLSDKDVDLMARTMLSEAGPNASAAEQAAIAHTILNRVGAPDYAPTVSGVVRQKGQFEPWSLPRQGPGSENHPSKWDVKSAAYQTAATIARGAASGSIEDPTGGADHFLQPETVQQRVKAGKMAWPSWASGDGQRIGQHTFYTPQQPRDLQPDAVSKLKVADEAAEAEMAGVSQKAATQARMASDDEAADKELAALSPLPSKPPAAKGEAPVIGQTAVAENPLAAAAGKFYREHPYLAGGATALAAAPLIAMLPEEALAVGGGMAAKGLWNLVKGGMKAGAHGAGLGAELELMRMLGFFK